MTTILGPAPCHDCARHVWVVRRTVEVPCDGGERAKLVGLRCGCERWVTSSHTHAIPDAAWTVVDADGERHRCPEVAVA